jgi:hypothetical protein
MAALVSEESDEARRPDQLPRLVVVGHYRGEARRTRNSADG